MVIALSVVAPAGAITGGQPDGNRYAYGALLLVPGVTFCSGTLIDEDLVLTAAHGISPIPGRPIPITMAMSGTSLPEPGAVDALIGTTGQTKQRFVDVGYGQDGVMVGDGPPIANFSFVRKFSVQRYSPSNGSVGTQDPLWLILGNSPSRNHAAGCGGDSGSGIYTGATRIWL